MPIAFPVIVQSTEIFNRSILFEVVPSECKSARVIPLHKKGLKNLLNNYRPISILPIISKIFEKVLYTI